MNKHMAPNCRNLPCFEAFGVIFCPDVCSYFCLVCGGGRGHWRFSESCLPAEVMQAEQGSKMHPRRVGTMEQGKKASANCVGKPLWEKHPETNNRKKQKKYHSDCALGASVATFQGIENPRICRMYLGVSRLSFLRKETSQGPFFRISRLSHLLWVAVLPHFLLYSAINCH